MDNRIKQIFEHFGRQSQLNKMDEELKELSHAIKSGVKIDIIDECSDVYVMAAQFMYLHNIKLTDIINRVDYKLDRTLDRINTGYYDEIRQIKENKHCDKVEG